MFQNIDKTLRNSPLQIPKITPKHTLKFHTYSYLDVYEEDKREYVNC